MIRIKNVRIDWEDFLFKLLATIFILIWVGCILILGFMAVTAIGWWTIPVVLGIGTVCLTVLFFTAEFDVEIGRKIHDQN